MAAGDVVFLKPPAGRRYRSRLTRADGVVVELEGGSWNRIGGAERELPHDLAHLVVERGLGLDMGLWGVIAAGGVFGQVTVVAGRRPPHHERRGRAIFDGAKEPLGQAEAFVRVVCDAAVDGRVADPGSRWSVAALEREGAVPETIAALRAAARAWAAVPPGGELAERWAPRRPSAPGPPRRRPPARGRRSR